MRTIKFRAWDKKRKEMMVIDSLEFSLENKRHLWGFLKNKRKIQFSFDARDVEIMQYTGLKDKNGKGMYEGDIVKYHKGGIGEIYYDKDFASFKIEWHKEGKFTHLKAMMIASEVIGNIYENPKLLK